MFFQTKIFFETAVFQGLYCLNGSFSGVEYIEKLIFCDEPFAVIAANMLRTAMSTQS
jgi:hypothetical protein